MGKVPVLELVVFRDIGVSLVIEREVVADVVSQHGPDLHAVVAVGIVDQVGGAKPAHLLPSQ